MGKIIIYFIIFFVVGYLTSPRNDHNYKTIDGYKAGEAIGIMIVVIAAASLYNFLFH